MSSQLNSAIPTPPFSPKHDCPDQNSLQPTIQLFDSLIDFYRQQCIWASRTRTALREAAQRDTEFDVEYMSGSLPSPPDSTIEQECSEKSSPESPKQTLSRWQRRKTGFKLRLDGLDRKRVYRSENLVQRERILQMFEKMIEARLESCERVNRLVRNANRADLQHH